MRSAPLRKYGNRGIENFPFFPGLASADRPPLAHASAARINRLRFRRRRLQVIRIQIKDHKHQHPINAQRQPAYINPSGQRFDATKSRPNTASGASDNRPDARLLQHWANWKKPIRPPPFNAGNTTAPIRMITAARIIFRVLVYARSPAALRDERNRHREKLHEEHRQKSPVHAKGHDAACLKKTTDIKNEENSNPTSDLPILYASN